MDAFYDHEEAFNEYLRDRDVEDTAALFGLQLRNPHRIHSKVKCPSSTSTESSTDAIVICSDLVFRCVHLSKDYLISPEVSFMISVSISMVIEPWKAY